MGRNRSMLTVQSLLACVLLLVSTSVIAGDYLPLEIGNFWNYRTAESEVENKMIFEQVTVLDQDVYAIEYIESQNNLGLKNFWTSGEDGDVLLHGFDRGFGYVYDPPVLVVDAPLFVGKTWTSRYDAYSLPDTIYDSSWEVIYEVFEEGVYEVGAGSLPGFGVRDITPFPASSRMDGFSLCGEIRGPQKNSGDSWYSESIGCIQYTIQGHYMLDSYNGSPVSTKSLAWDDIKALFR